MANPHGDPSNEGASSGASGGNPEPNSAGGDQTPKTPALGDSRGRVAPWPESSPRGHPAGALGGGVSATISLLTAAGVGVATWGILGLAGFWAISLIGSPPRMLAALGIAVWLVAAAGSMLIALALAASRSGD
jgi:hypothetical protein